MLSVVRSLVLGCPDASDVEPAGTLRARAGGGRCSPSGRGDMRTLRDRLDATRRSSFVGRTVERDRFAAALGGEAGAFSVFYVHGPGGMGKSTLLNRLTADARAAGRPVVEVDGRLVEASPHAF